MESSEKRKRKEEMGRRKRNWRGEEEKSLEREHECDG